MFVLKSRHHLGQNRKKSSFSGISQIETARNFCIQQQKQNCHATYNNLKSFKFYKKFKIFNRVVA
jgi:hypothetical protein